MSRQTFGSALKQPWALVLHGAGMTPGRRRGTCVAYLTDDMGEHYLGGYVWFGREWAPGPGGVMHRDKYPCWHYHYRHAREIPKAMVLHIFHSRDKTKFGGPPPAEIRAAKLAQRPVPAEEPREVLIPITWREDEADELG